MRIAYVSADKGIPLWGNKGSSVHVRSVCEALADLDHSVQIVTSRIGKPSSTEFRPHTIEIPFDRSLKGVRRRISDQGHPVLSKEIDGLLRNAAIHDCLLEAEDGGSLDGVYERYSLWSLAGLRFARCRGLPFVLEVNAPLAQEQQQYRELELGSVAAGIENQLWTEADAIFVPSRELAEIVRTSSGRQGRIHVTPNGVHVAAFQGPQRLREARDRSSSDRFVVVFVGSLKPWHGISDLLAAFRRLSQRLPRAKLLVVGDGPMRSEVEEIRHELGESRVELTGELSHDQVVERLASADVGVAPYPGVEPFYFSPMKVIEYMASGLPVVASSIGQLETLVEPGMTGLLVEPGSPESLASALELLANDPRSSRRMGRKAQRRALRRYSWEGVARRIEGVFEQLIENRDLAPTFDDAEAERVVRDGGGR